MGKQKYEKKASERYEKSPELVCVKVANGAFATFTHKLMMELRLVESSASAIVVDRLDQVSISYFYVPLRFLLCFCQSSSSSPTSGGIVGHDQLGYDGTYIYHYSKQALPSRSSTSQTGHPHLYRFFPSQDSHPYTCPASGSLTFTHQMAPMYLSEMFSPLSIVH
jgi:hypothetical protein